MDMKEKEKMEHQTKTNYENMNCLQKFNCLFTKFMYSLGKIIALYPSYFILIPLFTSLVSLTGLQQQLEETDFETLWYPRDGPAQFERSVIENAFPVSYESFIPYHATRLEGFTRVFVAPKDGGTIFRTKVWDEIVDLDLFIKNITVTYQNEDYNYTNLCTKWQDKCYDNEVFKLTDSMGALENGSLQINYPLMLFPRIVPMYFGGIKLDNESTVIESAEALSISYFLRLGDPADKDRARLWETKFLDILVDAQFRNINISVATSASVHDETSRLAKGLDPMIPVIATAMAIYTLFSVLSSDWVRSKPYIGLVGMAVSALSTFTAIGILAYLQIPSSGLNSIIPFLMLGIGLDDMFVVLSAWRRTDIQWPVHKRLAETYAEAGVSITITSLTNIVSFGVGLTTPVGAVRIFCLFTAFSLFVLYIWQVTLFGACLSIAGKFEQNQRHSILCIKVQSKSEAESEGRRGYKFWCAGGINPYDPKNPKDNHNSSVMIFFRDVIGNWLITSYAKCVLLILYILYIGTAIYGCTEVQEGLDRFKMVPHDSYAINFFLTEDKLFRKFPYSIQVAITGDIEYSNPKIQDLIMKLHGQMEDLPFIHEGYFTQSYIRSFYRYLRRSPQIRKSIHNESDFVTIMKERMDESPPNPKTLDIAFNEDYTKITASRFILQAYEVNTTNADRDMMLMLRHVAANFTDLNVTVFNPNFILFDQYGGVRAAIIQATLVAAASMLAISLVFIPNAMCSVVVGFSIISIEIGVIGFMSLWGVNLDPVSTITLMMGIGFSVDFTAHMSYSYLASKSKTPQEKLKESLFCLGLPILQGGASTILCVVCFLFIPSYAYQAFFKVVLIIITAATVHGLLFIPTILMICDMKLNSTKGFYATNVDFENDAPIVISIKSLMPVVEPLKTLSTTVEKSNADMEYCSDTGSDISHPSISTKSSEAPTSSDDS